MKENKLVGAALKSHLARLARLAGLPPEVPAVVKPLGQRPVVITTLQKHKGRFRVFTFAGYKYHIDGVLTTRRAVSKHIEVTYGR